MTIPPRKPLALAAICALALAPAGCTSKSTSTATSTTTTVSTPAPAATLPADAKFKGKKAGAAADVKLVDCPTAQGDQTAKLELTNSTKAARDYAIMVIWLKNDSGTPLGAAMVKQKAAAPGKKLPLSVKARVVSQADRCVLNVYAGTLA